MKVAASDDRKASYAKEQADAEAKAKARSAAFGAGVRKVGEIIRGAPSGTKLSKNPTQAESEARAKYRSKEVGKALGFKRGGKVAKRKRYI